jgi:hypothetical protein
VGGASRPHYFAHIVFTPQKGAGGENISRPAFHAETVDISILCAYIIGQEQYNH